MTQFAFGYGFALFTALFVIAGDVALKHAADGAMPLTSRHVIFGAAIYAASAILWYFAMRHITLAQAGVAYSMLTLIALAAIGALYFGEVLGAREYAGLGCACLAMVLMSRLA
jgi:undecaprenyl phosphate-alpha-L-ara4N flippase subunit ArnF